jgi:thiol-disulfide isomerase/thioredoxin
MKKISVLTLVLLSFFYTYSQEIKTLNLNKHTANSIGIHTINQSGDKLINPYSPLSIIDSISIDYEAIIHGGYKRYLYELSYDYNFHLNSDCKVHLILYYPTSNINKPFVLFYDHKLLNKDSVLYFDDSMALVHTFSFCDSERKLKLKLFNQSSAYEGFGLLQIKNLDYYSFLSPSDSNTHVYLTSSFLGVQLHSFTERPLKGDKKWQIFNIDEEVRMNGQAMTFYDYNPIENTIKYRLLDTEKLNGYKEGYFNTETLSYLDKNHQIKSKNILLYFWGIWCIPCVKNIHFTKEVASLAFEKDVEFLYVSSLFEYSDFEKTLNFLEREQIKEHSIYQSIKKINSIDDKLLKYLSIDMYPTYILMSESGQILYRGFNKDNKLNEILSTM